VPVYQKLLWEGVLPWSAATLPRGAGVANPRSGG